MSRTADAWDKGSLCQSCHNEDNDPHFKFATYYPQINHKGLDTYEDPKVHQGQPAITAKAKVATRTTNP